MKQKRQLKKLRGRSTDTNALLTDAQMQSDKEESALSTEQRANDAAVKDVQIELSKEASA